MKDHEIYALLSRDAEWDSLSKRGKAATINRVHSIIQEAIAAHMATAQPRAVELPEPDFAGKPHYEPEAYLPALVHQLLAAERQKYEWKADRLTTEIVERGLMLQKSQDVLTLVREALEIALNELNKRIDFHVEENFGRCPGDDWFTKWLDQREQYEAALKAVAGRTDPAEQCTDERMCGNCFSGQGTCERSAIAAIDKHREQSNG